MLQMPTLETPRLSIRPFALADLAAVHQLLDVELTDADTGTAGELALESRRRWLEWTVLNYEQLAWLNQPPFGDRAIILRTSGQLIGACGYVPSLAPFRQLPTFNRGAVSAREQLSTFEFGLYYAISPHQQRQGYASEAARALVDYAFEHLQVQRVVATTSYENQASIGVMRRLGMRVERNPYPDPPWLQVVGILEQPS